MATSHPGSSHTKKWGMAYVLEFGCSHILHILFSFNYCYMHIHTVRHSQRRHLLAAHKIVHQQTGTVMGGGEAQEKSNSSNKEQQ